MTNRVILARAATAPQRGTVTARARMQRASKIALERSTRQIYAIAREDSKRTPQVSRRPKRVDQNKP